MPMKWDEVSAIVAGLVLDKRLPVSHVNEKALMPPYDELIKEYKKSDDMNDLLERVGLFAIQDAMHQAESVNGTSKLADFVVLCERARLNYEAGELLSRISKKLLDGDSVDWSKVTSIADRAQSGIGNGYSSMDKVEAMQIPFKETGFASLDKHFGGLPEVGQVLVGGTPSSGKTSFMLGLVSSWVVHHPGEVVVINTIEMLKEELKMRLGEVYRLNDEQLSRILVDDATDITPSEAISKAASVENLGLMCVDYIDLQIEGETSESTMSAIYRTYMKGAKSLHIPIVNLAQLNRNYTGGIPRPFNLRYTGMAEALGWSILMLYNPSSNWFADSADDDILSPVVGKGYIIGWKFRGGFRVHKKDNPGAIQIDFDGGDGWNPYDTGKWYPVKDQKRRIRD